MFDAGIDARTGIPVVNELYPEGEAGIQKSLGVICKKIREGAATAVMKSYAGNVLKQAGFPKSNAERAAAFLYHVRQHVAYAHDALGTEMIQSAQVSLCVDGAPVCIPIGDCFPEGTLLLREDGQLVPIEEIKPGERIWGLDKWVRVEAKVFKGKLKVDAIEMNNGSTMYLTPDHKVYASKPGAPRGEIDFERMAVSDLSEKDFLLQPERVAFGKQSVEPDRMYIEALALADGWTQPSKFCIAGRDGKRKEAQKHEVKVICERLGIPTHWHRRYITVKDSAWGSRIASLGSRARFKHLETLDLDEGTAAAALRGLMADSTQNTNGPGRTYSTTSRTMMVQVRVLHRMFGGSTSVKMLTPEQHGGEGKHPLWRLGVRVSREQHALERAEKTLAVRSIERAVKKVSCWDIQTEDHYVYLPEHDVTVSNCDDLSCALGTLLGAAGIEVRLVRQFFGSGNQQHVLVEAKLENGRWFPLDPSSSKMPAGEKAKAVKETYCSPWDENVTGLSSDAQFVGIGALPVFLYGKEGWRQVQEFEQVSGGSETAPIGLGDGEKRWYPVGQNVQAPLPAGRVMLWEGGWWYRDPASGTVYQWTCCSGCAHGKGCGEKVDALAVADVSQAVLSAYDRYLGLGDIAGDITAALKLPSFSLDPMAIVRQFWGQVQGRSWDQAMASAYARASSMNWIAKDAGSKADLIALLISSAINSKILADRGDLETANDLTRTWVVIARKMGVKAPTPAEIAGVKSRATGNIEVLIPVLIAAVIAEALVAITIVIALVWLASTVIDDVLSKIICDRELVRLHADYNKIIEHRNANPNPNLPKTSDEPAARDKLIEEQKFVAAGCVRPKPPFDPWPYVIGIGLVSVATAGVVYHKEIGDWIEGRKTQ